MFIYQIQVKKFVYGNIVISTTSIKILQKILQKIERAIGLNLRN